MLVSESLTPRFPTVLQVMTGLACLKSNQIFSPPFLFCLPISIILAVGSPSMYFVMLGPNNIILSSPFWAEYPIYFRILIILFLRFILTSMLHSVSIDKIVVHYISFAKIYVLVLYCVYITFLLRIGITYYSPLCFSWKIFSVSPSLQKSWTQLPVPLRISFILIRGCSGCLRVSAVEYFSTSCARTL